VTDKILSLFLFQGSLDKTFTTLTFLLRFDIPFTACTLQLNYMDKRKTGKQVLNVMSKHTTDSLYGVKGRETITERSRTPKIKGMRSRKDQDLINAVSVILYSSCP
jgi:hypothetical protein